MAYGVFIVTRAQSKAQKREKNSMWVCIEGVKVVGEEERHRVRR